MTVNNTIDQQTKNYLRYNYATYESLCNQANEKLAALRSELQEYHDNASKGGKDRKKYMGWLKEDIKKLENMKEIGKQAFMAEEIKTMQEIENQGYRLCERNWRRVNVWPTSEASKAAKNSRDKLICKAYLNAAAKHLTAKAKAISEFLSVKPMHEISCVMLDYSSPTVGVALEVASPFCVESLLNDPDKVLARINA